MAIIFNTIVVLEDSFSIATVYDINGTRSVVVNDKIIGVVILPFHISRSVLFSPVCAGTFTVTVEVFALEKFTKVSTKRGITEIIRKRIHICRRIMTI
eukprot:Pgem_evm1s17842